jgi:hypothetical protein
LLICTFANTKAIIPVLHLPVPLIAGQKIFSSDLRYQLQIGSMHALKLNSPSPVPV